MEVINVFATMVIILVEIFASSVLVHVLAVLQQSTARNVKQQDFGS